MTQPAADMKITYVLAAAFLSFQALTIACGSVAPTPNTSPAPGTEMEVTIGPARVECYVPFPDMCLIVDGEIFWGEAIAGFTHESGYEYRLRLERYDRWPGRDEIPQDASRYGYRLLEEISRTRVSGEKIEAGIAPARVNCPKSDALCMCSSTECLSQDQYPVSSTRPATITASHSRDSTTVLAAWSKWSPRSQPMVLWKKYPSVPGESSATKTPPSPRPASWSTANHSKVKLKTLPGDTSMNTACASRSTT